MRRAMMMGAAAALLAACEDTGPVGTATLPHAQDTAVRPPALAAPTGDLPAWFDCLDREGIALVSAHRGTDGRMPENGLASIQSVVGRTGGLVEVDVATSSDGVLFLHHDDTLDRTTTGRGPVDAAWDTLRTLSLRDEDGRATAQGVTRLDDLLRWAEGKAIIQLDIKQGTDYDDVAAVLRETGASDRVVVIAYSLGQARVLARKMPGVMISATVQRTDDLEALIQAGIPADRILAWTGNDAPNPRLYEALDEAGVEVIFGTLGGYDSLDEEFAAQGRDEGYAELAREGVDIIATDRPVEAARALGEGGVTTDASVCLRT